MENLEGKLDIIGIVIIAAGILGSIVLAQQYGNVVDYEFYSHVYYKRDVGLTLGIFVAGSAVSLITGYVFFWMGGILNYLEKIQKIRVENDEKMEKKLDELIKAITNTERNDVDANGKNNHVMAVENVNNTDSANKEDIPPVNEIPFKSLTEIYEFVEKEAFPVGADIRIKNEILQIKKLAPKDDDADSLKQAYAVIENYRKLCKRVMDGTFSFEEKNGDVRCPVCGEKIKDAENQKSCFTCGFKWKI